MKEHPALAILAAYAVAVFVGGFVWKQLRKYRTQPSGEKANKYVPAARSQ
jgi:hypothetical protein